MRAPDLDQLEPIERASRDELAALQATAATPSSVASRISSA
jgi:hypothetical protein